MKNIFCKKNTLKAFSLIEISMVILIVGILISGISKSFDLYEDFILVNAKKITKNSIVPRIEGLGLWLETTLDESFNSDFSKNDTAYSLPWKSIVPRGDKIIIKNGQGYYVTKRINSLPAITWNQMFEMASSDIVSAEGLATNDGVTIFVVYQCYHQYPSTCGSLVAIESSDAGASYRYGIAHMWGGLGFWIGHNGALNSVGYGYSDENIRKLPRIITARASDSKISISIDGLEVANGNVVQSIKPIGNQIYVRIGFSTGESQTYRYIKGIIGEVIIYGRSLKDKEAKSVEEYLSKKWRIPINKNF
jgi:prepilin-type N-terminal cleavage/methylation domain-containing protein